MTISFIQVKLTIYLVNRPLVKTTQMEVSFPSLVFWGCLHSFFAAVAGRAKEGNELGLVSPLMGFNF